MNNTDKYTVLLAFQKKYNLKFRDWIENDIADFKFWVFSVKQMKYALETEITLDELFFIA